MPCPCRAHAVPLPCHATKGLECVFPIWFTQCGHIWFTLAMPCLCHAPTMPFFSRPQHCRAVSRRPCCAVALRKYNLYYEQSECVIICKTIPFMCWISSSFKFHLILQFYLYLCHALLPLPSGFSIKILHTFFLSPKHSTFLHPLHHQFINPEHFSTKYKFIPSQR